MNNSLAKGVVVVGGFFNAVSGALSLMAPGTFLAITGHSGEQLTTATRLFAAYAGARELSIAVALIVLLAMRSTRLLACLLVVTAFANVVDGIDALVFQRWVQIPGALIFALLYLATAAWLWRQPLESSAV